jgi:phosphate transport system substrate-binding protein
MKKIIFATITAIFSTSSAPTAETIAIDGSSTVYPITVAMAEQYQRLFPEQKFEIGGNGSSAGFRRLLSGEVRISGASRPIKSKELTAAEAAGLSVIEMPVAFDGITVVVSQDNTFIDHLSVDELKLIFRSDNPASSWDEVRAGWPAKPIAIFGPGSDSGTYEFFNHAVLGKGNAPRNDYTMSEDDRLLVQNVVANPGAISYFGWAYYLENESLLKAVPITTDAGTVSPSDATIKDGSYKPFARPIFMYADVTIEKNLADFMRFYLRNIVPKVDYISLGTDTYELVRRRFDNKITGSLMGSERKGTLIARLAEDLPQQSEPATPATITAAVNPVTAAPAQPMTSAMAPPVYAAQPMHMPMMAPRMPYGHIPAVPAATPREFALAVEDIRDASLRLSREAMDDRTTVAELARQIQIIQTHVNFLAYTQGYTITLGAGSGR